MAVPIASPLLRVLGATGYVVDGGPAPGVRFSADAQHSRGFRTFRPDASWRGASALSVYFKFAKRTPDPQQVKAWRREVWNEGYGPVLWVVSEEHATLYNAFARPSKEEDEATHRLASFRLVDEELRRLDEFAGRVTMDTGQFWSRNTQINRKTAVDRQLLRDLGSVERRLVNGGLDRSASQALIARAIFAQYLIDRGIVTTDILLKHTGTQSLADTFSDGSAARALFDWLAEVFNGDMFPPSMSLDPATFPAASVLSDFLSATDPVTFQQSLFPYQFDIIPVELISTIYEQFVNTDPRDELALPAASGDIDTHYTPITLVELILDEVFDGLSGNERVLDLTCGSGVFLVEALRRLVALTAHGKHPTRKIVRNVLQTQLFGVDRSEAAIRVAAFSLYLAAVELDPDPQADATLRFEPLIGRSLIAADAASADAARLLQQSGPATFDIIVGNPPWSFRGRQATAARAQIERADKRIGASRTPALDFVWRAINFSNESTRLGIVLSAMPFFATAPSAVSSVRALLESVAPATLINLAHTRSWLFPHAKTPAVVLLGRCATGGAKSLTVVDVPWQLEGEKAHTFSITPSDVTVVSLQEVATGPAYGIKSRMYGTPRDRALLRQMMEECESLKTWLKRAGAKLQDGLQFGSRTKEAPAFLQNLELLDGDVHFSPFGTIPINAVFGQQRLHRPRRETQYQAPVVLVREGFQKSNPRPVTSVVERNLAYTEAFFGVSFSKVPDGATLAHLLAGILGSSLTAWFLWLTAAEFGVHKRRLHVSDIEAMLVPDLQKVAPTRQGRRLIDATLAMRTSGVNASRLHDLDDAVAEVYRLNEADKQVVQSGLERASWEWVGARRSALSAANTPDLREYAHAFMGGIDVLLRARQARSIRAEVFVPRASTPLRAVRFVFLDGYEQPRITEIPVSDSLSDILERIARRLGVALSSALAGRREIIAQSESEILVVKSAARRNWLPVQALNDADSVLLESLTATGIRT